MVMLAASDQEFDEFIDICERITTLSNELNRFNLTTIKSRSYQLEPHEQAIYTLHIRHVLDFCKVLEGVAASSGPNAITPTPSTNTTTDPNGNTARPSATADRGYISTTPAASPSEQTINPRGATSAVPPRGVGSSSQNHTAALGAQVSYPVSANMVASTSPPSSIPAAGAQATCILDRCYYAGSDYMAQGEMDINIRKGDRIKVVTLMDNDTMGLGSNLETGAMGTFLISCITTGTLAPEGAEDELPANPDDQNENPSSSEVNANVAVAGPSTTAERQREWSPIPVPNPLNRKIGRHVAARAYQSGSVLEASLERGDEVEIMFWEDDEIAVGIHIPTQLEGLFRGSMLLFAGSEGGEPSASASSLQNGGSVSAGVRVVPLNDGRVVEIPADVPFAERKESLDKIARGATVQSGLSATGDSSERKNILAAVVAFQQNDANQYKDYLDRIDETPQSSSQSMTPQRLQQSPEPTMARNITSAVVSSLRNSPVQVSLENLHPSLLQRVQTTPNPPGIPHSGASGMSSLPHGITVAGGPHHSHHQSPSSPNAPMSPGSVLPNPVIAAAIAASAASGPSSPADVQPPPRVSSAVFGKTITGERGVPSASAELTPEEERRLQGAKHVLAELHATEESYMNLLRVFQEFVVEPMREARILSNVDIDRAFKHLQPIHELSVKVEMHLREAAHSGTGDPTPVVNLFLKNIQHEEWIVYENYIKNYQPAKQILQKMTARTDAKGEQFRAFCRKIEKDDNCDRKNLDDFMMLPIQRITRYWLLLERLKKYMETGSVAYEGIEVAERYMKEVGNTLQGVQIREEEMRKMFEIVNTVDNCPSSILSYSKRRFVAEHECMDLVGATFGYGIHPAAGGVFHEGGHENTDIYQNVSNMVQPGPGSRRLFVFTDCLLVAAYRTGRKSAAAAKKLELVQKLDSKRVMIDNRRDDVEMETDIILRLRIVSPFVGKPDDMFHFRMNDVRARKSVEKAIMMAHAPLK
ncbi:hypothetical protein HDU67_008905 [Dinochytrium kinnereticum]|nr:hypothetical protein HDU67_008905 [Dinochytrium kinnereticum]